MMHSTAKVVTGVDTHAHIFQRDLPLVEGRRYSPDYDARVETYLAHLDRCGLSHGVLVQPSFLGTDNDYLVAALRRYPERLRGTAVVEPTISAAALDALDAAGVASVRLNLIGKTLDDYAAAPWQRFFTELAQRRWSVEIQRGMEDLDAVVAPILGAGCDVVIDHFGLPGGEIDPVNPAHRALLTRMAHQPLWIKLSATYRSRSSLDQASRSIERLRDAYGHSEHLLWGSDWPHTRFEEDTDYDAQFALLEKLLPDSQERRQVLVDNPARLFRIALADE